MWTEWPVLSVRLTLSPILLALDQNCQMSISLALDQKLAIFLSFKSWPKNLNFQQMWTNLFEQKMKNIHNKKLFYESTIEIWIPFTTFDVESDSSTASKNLNFRQCGPIFLNRKWNISTTKSLFYESILEIWILLTTVVESYSRTENLAKILLSLA